MSAPRSSSLDDDRVGRVDLSVRLGADAERPPSPGAGALTGALSEAQQRLRQATTSTDGVEAPSPVPLILPPAKFDQTLAGEVAHLRREQVQDPARTPPEVEEESTDEPYETGEPDQLHDTRPTGPTGPTGQEVAAVAEIVTARMRSVGEAHERHLEAIELEAARRCELQTAQAELDAELIRLHARREAHAIIAAARMRVGHEPAPVETDRLGEIGETFSRFAESIETIVASGPSSPDPLWTP